jgi:outer membrane protein assembly factor BamD
MIRRFRRALGVACLAVASALPASAKDKYENLSDRQLYDLAIKRMDGGDYYKARVLLENLIRRPNVDAELLPLVQLGLADAYYGKKGLLNLTEAMSRYSNFLTFYPTHPKADYAQYRLALCHFQQVYAADRDQTETRTAIQEFRRVQTQYPDSAYVDLAAEKIQESSDLLADHEYRVGRFYHSRRAYLGAIDRFLVVLDKYPRYADKDGLYYYLGESLIRTERTEEGEVYLQKLVETYPDSKYADRAKGLLAFLRKEGAAAPSP